MAPTVSVCAVAINNPNASFSSIIKLENTLPYCPFQITCCCKIEKGL